MKFATINFEGVAEPIVALEEKEPRLLKDVCKKLNAPNFDCLENFISFIPSNENFFFSLKDSIPKSPIIKIMDHSWLPPVRKPGKILGVAFNNKELMKKAHKDPGVPNFFLKPSSSLQAHMKEIAVDPTWGAVIPEPEVCAIIGIGGKNISKDRALDHIFGYSILNDVTSHGLKFGKDSIAVTYDPDMAREEFYNWRNLKDENDRDVYYVYHTRSKGTDTFGPMGPWITYKEEVGEPNELKVKAYLNGKVFTEDSTANYRFSIEDCVSEASKYFTLEPGDIISFGTTGKGNADFPRGHKSVLLGEVSGEITIEVPKLGTLRNTIFHKTGGL